MNASLDRADEPPHFPLFSQQHRINANASVPLFAPGYKFAEALIIVHASQTNGQML